ncbi:hypothetical protein GCM10027037_03040 [Mucilaginibacter koreensis]
MKYKLSLFTTMLICALALNQATAQRVTTPVNKAPVTPPTRQQNEKATPTPKQEEADTEGDEEGDVNIKIEADPKKAIFTGLDDIKFNIDLKSTYKVRQDGRLNMLVTTTFGTKVAESAMDVHLGKKGSTKLHVKLPPQNAGFYQITFRFNLSMYDDTIKRVFGVDPTEIEVSRNKPKDFDKFWADTKAGLDTIEPQYITTLDKKQSTPEKNVYLVEMHSYGDAVIRGWLTVPTKRRPKKIPVKYRLGGYIVAMKPTLEDDDFAVFNINVRGSGNSKDAVSYTGEFNLWNIENRDKYIYRGVYMDCIRGLDFIYANASKFGFDLERVNVDGGSQGAGLAIMLAGLDPRVRAVTSELPLYSDLRDAIRIGPKLYPYKQSPIWMFTDYMRRNKSFTEKKLFATWDYYDPIMFAPKVKCPVLVAVSLLDEMCPPYCSFALFNKLGTDEKEKEFWVNPVLTHEVDNLYYGYQYYWIKEKFVLP